MTLKIDADFCDELWYGDHPLSLFLAPLGWVYCSVVKIRHLAYTVGVLPSRRVQVPIIVVGNITVGGTGKTPLIIWLSELLKQQGHRPGIITRGYGGRSQKWPQQVRPDSNPDLVGDEPVLLAQRTACPVAVSPDRYIAARELLAHTDCDVLLLDDGLQHLGLDRDLEIAVIDGDRRFGNGHCLPAGPLREPPSRLSSVDMIVSNGKAGRSEYLMEYEYGDLCALSDGRKMTPEALRGNTVHAVTGIGNPSRFYSYLRSHDIRIIKHKFADHYRFMHRDLDFNDDLAIVMTEKDAVKCRRFATARMWYLPITACFTQAFQHRILVLLERLFDG